LKVLSYFNEMIDKNDSKALELFGKLATMKLEENQSEVTVMERVVQTQFIFIDSIQGVILGFGADNGVGFKVD
jgi:hypothetical protein